ncbi:MAG: sensor histidine kinase [Acetobacteraceae bacterium]|nr:sensor histidine kinase [Acetobacteraceae bacterium]
MQSQALPVRGGAEAGRPGDRAAEWIGATTDVEELRRAQEQRILIEELHHRGRNLLAVVAGIADQMLPSCGSLEEFGACFDQRLVALGRVQNLLSREVVPNVTMEELLRLELEAHGVDTDGTGRVQLRGPGVVLPGGSLQMLALALHELTTNALKHGALNNSTGRLDVAWELRQDGTDAPRLRLDWAEIGADLPDNGGAWSRRGFGLELLEVVLPYDLQGGDAPGVRPGWPSLLDRAAARAVRHHECHRPRLMISARRMGSAGWHAGDALGPGAVTPAYPARGTPGGCGPP